MEDTQTRPEPVLRRLPSDRRRPLAPLFAFAAVVMLKLYVLRVVLLSDANPLRALVLEGGFVLLLVSALAFLPRGRLWAWLALDAVLSIVCIAMLVYARQFDQVVTVGALGQSRELVGVREAVGALVRPAYLLFLADIPVLAALLVAVRRSGRARHRADGPSPYARLAVLVALGAMWVAAVVVPLAVATPPDDSMAGARSRGLLAYALVNPDASASAESETEIAQQVANAAAANAHSSPATSATGVNPNVANIDVGKVDVSSPASVQEAFDALQGGPGGVRVTSAPTPGVAMGHDVIFIQVESLSTWTTLVKVGGHEVTPYLNRLVGESWYAPKTITQIGPGNTSDAEFTANTSLLADRSQPTSYIFGDKKMPSLPRLVRDIGYEALTFHTNDVSYWKRNLLYPALGFSKWYSKPDFPHTDIIDGIGASDRVLYKKVAQVLEANHAAKTHFLAEVVTLAAHSPYLGASARSKLAVPASLHGTSLANYLRAINYEDVELGTFIERLKRDGIWDEAVVVIYGDHFGVRPLGGSSIPLTRREEQAIAEMLGRKPTWADTYEIPCLIHLPGQTRGQLIDTVRAQADIMPTIADVLGLDLSHTPHTGVSFFDARQRTVVMRHYVPNGTFVTDRYLFRPGAGYDDAKVSKLDGSGNGNMPLSTVPKALYERMKTLAALNRLYLTSLPKR